VSNESDGVSGGFRKRRKRKKGWQEKAQKAAEAELLRVSKITPGPGDVTINAPVATASGEVKKES
jgi:hypothetical protein